MKANIQHWQNIGWDLPKAADARFIITESNYDGLAVGKTSIKDNNKGKSTVMTDTFPKVTGRYVIATPISNDAQEPKTIQYLIMVTDENNTSQDIINGDFTAAAKKETIAGETIDGYGYLLWEPSEPGKYTIKVFFWSSTYLPLEPVSPPQSLTVEVKEKIVKLGVGEREGQLAVKYINLEDKNVTVSYPFCQ